MLMRGGGHWRRCERNRAATQFAAVVLGCQSEAQLGVGRDAKYIDDGCLDLARNARASLLDVVVSGQGERDPAEAAKA